MPRPSRGAPISVAQPSCPAWKANAAKALHRLHDRAAIVTPERLWTQLYIRRFTPAQAAELAEREYRSTGQVLGPVLNCSESRRAPQFLQCPTQTIGNHSALAEAAALRISTRPMSAWGPFASRRARWSHPSASELRPNPDIKSSCPCRREVPKSDIRIAADFLIRSPRRRGRGAALAQ